VAEKHPHDGLKQPIVLSFVDHMAARRVLSIQTSASSAGSEHRVRLDPPLLEATVDAATRLTGLIRFGVKVRQCVRGLLTGRSPTDRGQNGKHPGLRAAARSGFGKIRMLALVECGTRAVVHAAFGRASSASRKSPAVCWEPCRRACTASRPPRCRGCLSRAGDGGLVCAQMGD
jgi:hypothetical protein